MQSKLIAIPARPRLVTDPLPDAAQIADYLDGCPVLVETGVTIGDALDPGTNPAQLPVGARTDGTYSWPLALGHYVRAYGMPFDVRLIDHIRGRDYRRPRITKATMATLTSH